MNVTAVEIAKLDLKSGDTLAVMVPQLLSAEQREAVSSFMRSRISADVKFVILDGGVTIAKLSEPDAPAS